LRPKSLFLEKHVRKYQFFKHEQLIVRQFDRTTSINFRKIRKHSYRFFRKEKMASKKHVTVTWSFSTWSFLLTIRKFSKIRNFIISSWITVVLLALSRNWLANQFRTRFPWSDLNDRFCASVPKIALQLCRILSFQKARRDFQRVRRFFALLPFLRGKVITISKSMKIYFFRAVSLLESVEEI
jgi:hypothetical protein